MRGLNRKQRNKMAVVKEGLEVHDVHRAGRRVQFEKVNDAVAEPVVYMIDHFVVGGFYRVHTSRGKDENLNAPGHAVRAARVRGAVLSPDLDEPRCPPNRFYAYGVIARLALVAAARRTRETKEHDPNCRRAVSE